MYKTDSERAMETATLVLDDLGAGRPTAWAVEQIARLIDVRCTALLPTFVTSNFGPTRSCATSPSTTMSRAASGS